MANDINVVVLVGRLTRDAELRYINTGTAVTKVSLAVNRRKKSGDQWTEEANFFDVTIWGKQAETLAQYLTKGKQIGVQGELRFSKWEQDGQPRSKVEVVANSVQLLGGGSSGGSRAGFDGERAGGGGTASSSGPDDFEDDIPF